MRWLHWNAGSSHLQRRRLEMLPRQTSTPGDGWLEASTHNVRFGSKADICAATSHVRFTPNSDRESEIPQKAMSALPPKADMCGAIAYVCYGPIADIANAVTLVPLTWQWSQPSASRARLPPARQLTPKAPRAADGNDDEAERQIDHDDLADSIDADGRGRPVLRINRAFEC